MKKLIMVFFAFQCIVLTSCWHNHKNISFSYTSNDDSYSMDAWFSRNKTSIAEQYMNEKIGKENNISFVNTLTDAEFTLNDGSKFYMQKSPGHILIKMNKLDNSYEHYHKIQEMCKGMKDVVLK
ncbi:hypothetical protein QWZ08_11225 [Ferruginibacter paludis]|uniref:hypothetical protein n=1 Tax=Ferruginibacter paludis TaxID=1310417 RepID=UPI0025B4D416|nr:hypothetical protein [Ferruginibacter paludis]MDN3656202.1 hypothetical protein [Ferruginibacter paludis]